MNTAIFENCANFVNNSGVYDWQWGGNASCDGFAEYIHENCTSIDVDDYEGELHDYLDSVGEDPSDYL